MPEDLKFMDAKEFFDQYEVDGAPLYIKDSQIPSVIKLMEAYAMHIASGAGFWGGFASRMNSRFKTAMKFIKQAKSLVGNPGTNISFSTDSACKQWHDEVEKFARQHELYVE